MIPVRAMEQSARYSIIKLVLMMTLVRPGVCACPPDYVLYTREQVCVKAFHYQITWYRARDHCKRLKGGLVQLSTQHKWAFVQETRDRRYIYAVGLSDHDNDGTYEFGNGSKLTTVSPGLGAWDTRSLVNQRWTYRCVVTFYSRGLVPSSCDSARRFICEIPLEPATVPQDDKDLACKSEDCYCHKDKWIRSKGEDKYIAINKVLKTFTESQKICKHLGGRLLEDRQGVTGKFLRKLTNLSYPKNMFYWIGLRKERAGSWRWESFSKVDAKFTNWWTDNRRAEGCAAVLWDYDGKWRETSCITKNYFLCEAKKPCPTSLSMLLNGDELLPTDVAELTYEQSVDIRCQLTGHLMLVEKIVLSCDGRIEKNESEAKTAELSASVFVNWKMRGCKCEVTFKDETFVNSTVTFDLKVPPKLLDKNDSDRISAVKEGGEHAISFVVYANPGPFIYQLKDKVKAVSLDDYLVSVLPMEQHMLYAIDVVVDRGQKWSNVTTFRLVLNNGIDPQLEIPFRFTEPKKNDDPKHDGKLDLFALSMFMLLAICTFILPATVYYFVRGRRSKGENESLISLDVDGANRASVVSIVDKEPNQKDVLRRSRIRFESYYSGEETSFTDSDDDFLDSLSDVTSSTSSVATLPRTLSDNRLSFSATAKS